MGEADEHVFAGTLEPLAVVLDEAQETLYVRVVFKINGEYVPQVRFLALLPVSPKGN